MDRNYSTDSGRKAITPAELGALLVNVACAQSEQEKAAIGKLAAHLGVELNRLQQELSFLRAFAVELAVATALSPGAEKEEVRAYYYRNWERLAPDTAVLEQMRQRLDYYGQFLEADQRHPGGLGGLIGTAFAKLGAETAFDGLAGLGEAMFGRVFGELTELFEEVDIVLFS